MEASGDEKEIRDQNEDKKGSKVQTSMEETNKRICYRCQYHERVLHTSQLKAGQHLCVPGRYLRHDFNFAGRKVIKYLYTHHLIVTNIVKIETDAKCLISVHHFDTSENNRWKPEVQNGEMKIDLQSDEVYIIKHKGKVHNDSFNEKEFVGKFQNEKLRYSVLTNNCEHHSNSVQTGIHFSKQIMELFTKLKNASLEALRFLGNIIKKKVVSAEKLSKILDEITETLNLPSKLASKYGVFGVTYLLLAIQLVLVLFIYATYYNDNMDGILCEQCLDLELKRLIATYLVDAAISLGSSALNFLLVNCSAIILNGIFILTILVGIAASIAIYYAFQYASNVFPYSRTKLSSVTDIREGDILSLTYYGLDHKVLVLDFTHKNSTKGMLKCLHYAYRGLFQKRRIQEDEFSIDVTKSNIYRCDIEAADAYDKDEVIRRAILRQGEEKFHTFTNRSSHFCFWAKVKLEKRLSTSSQESFSICCIAEIHIPEELSLGAVLQYGRDSGIVIEEHRNDGRRIRITVIRAPGCWKSPRRETWNIDLSKDRLYLQCFHPQLVVSAQETIDNAKRFLHQDETFMTSDHFISKCILKNKDVE